MLPGQLTYLERYAYLTGREINPINSELIIVLPAYNEPGLIDTLTSLNDCTFSGFTVHVLVIINYPEESATRVVKFSEEQQAQINDRSWKEGLEVESFSVELPKKKAGVGLARKIGMDLAISAIQKDSILIGLDADCKVDPNYLEEIHLQFAGNPETDGASIYFEHDLESTKNEAIAEYELHLRYFIQAQRYAGFPHAFHTVGSSMAVRASSYIKQGGMNTRKAGEDFYFLHRIIPLGNFTEINSTRVIPSARESERVPFGTGRAMLEYAKSGAVKTYPLEILDELKKFFRLVEKFYQGENGGIPPEMNSFLIVLNFESALDELRRKSNNLTTFIRHFYNWFNAFQLMKYANYRREQIDREVNIVDEAADLLKLLNIDLPGRSALDLLEIYRSLDRDS